MDEALERIYELWDAGEMEAVIARCTERLEGQPESPAGWALRGAARAALGDHVGGITDLSRAIDLEPDRGWTWAVRGGARADAGQEIETLADLTRADELEPDDAWTLARRFQIVARSLGVMGFALTILDGGAADPAQWIDEEDPRAGDAQAALEDIQRAIELDRATVVGVLRPELDEERSRAEERWSAGDYGGVVDLCADTLETYPMTGWALRMRGGARVALGDLEGGITDLSGSIDLEPDWWWGWAVRGAAHDGAGHQAEALADLTRAIELEPDVAWSRARRFRIIARRHGLFAAIQRIVNADDPDFSGLEAIFGVQDEELLMAWTDLQRAIELDPAEVLAVILPGVTNSSGDVADLFSTVRWIRPHREGDLEQILASATAAVRGTGNDKLATLIGLDMALAMRITVGVAGAAQARSTLAGLAIAEIDSRADHAKLASVRQSFQEHLLEQ